MSSSISGAEPTTRAAQPTWVRWAIRALVLVLLVVIGLSVAGVAAVRTALPQTAGTLELDGVSDKVTVRRDAHGVAQIYANNTDDLFFGQGFVQAQERFWQMDVGRHLTSGRLSELFGRSTLKTDELVRAMGWRRVAQQEFRMLSPDTQGYLIAFSEGVNAYLDSRSVTSMGVEYTILGLTGLDYEPAEWSPVDSVAWLKAMAWDQRNNLGEEIDRANLSPKLTQQQIADLLPDYPYATNPPIMAWPPQTMSPAEIGQSAPSLPRPAFAPALRKQDQSNPEPIFGGDTPMGGNSIAVSGRFTDTGKPYLEADPHLLASQPSAWYQTGLHCTNVSVECPFDVSGFAAVGFPGVMIGHNARIAWSLTNMLPDVTDLYLEKIQGQDSLYDGQWVPLVKHDEVIRIRGSQSKVFTVRSTKHGPLLSDVSAQLSSVGANADVPQGSPDRGNGYGVALAWTGLTPRPTADAVFLLNRAGDFADFRAAAARFAVPAQNMLYADVDGNIGYQAPGDIPSRNLGNRGDAPVPGWDSTFDWQGTVPFERLPSVLNPRDGFIVAASQAPTPPNYPHLISTNFDYGWRAHRIKELLQRRMSSGRVSASDLLSISSDTSNPIAPVLTPYLLKQLMTSAYYADGQRLLVDWDYRQPTDSAAAAYFNVVWANVLKLTFGDQLPEDQWPTGGDRSVAVVSKLLGEDNNLWWDDIDTEHVVEDRDMILSQAMREARDELTMKQSVDADAWQWGRIHQLEMVDSPLGSNSIGVVKALLNRGPYPVAGGSAAVLATNWDATSGYQMTSGPSMRMLVDMADFDRSRWINVGGQSGHVGSRNYVDQVKLWAANKTLAWASSPSQVRKRTHKTLSLKPSS